MVKSVRTDTLSHFGQRTKVSNRSLRALRNMDQRLLTDIGVEGFVESHQDPLAQIAGLR